MAGFEIPADAPIIIVEINGIGTEHPLSAETLSPVLSLYFVENFAAALDACEAVLRFGGLGHTCGIYAKDDARIREYALRMPAYRVVANTPTPKGSTGITTNVFPAMTLGCGAIAGNSTSDNISPLHLINIKRLAYDRESVTSSPTRQGEGYVSSGNAPRKGEHPTWTVVRNSSRRRGGYLARRGMTGNASAVAPSTRRRLSGSADVRKGRARGPLPPQPRRLVDFVCEDDVRQAIRESRKIFIGPKSHRDPFGARSGRSA